jgi:two-component system NtrC family response regulator
MLFSVGGLVLVHNLYTAGTSDTRMALRLPLTAIAFIWVYDLNLYTVSYLSGVWSSELIGLRGIAVAMVAPLVALSANVTSGLRVHLSRTATFQTLSLGAIGAYLGIMVVVNTFIGALKRAFHVHAIEVDNMRLASVSPGSISVLGGMITAAPEMLKVATTIERVAKADVSVMLLGASGTGKELLARGLHESSNRATGPFVAINCAAIPETLLEAELFGHEKGAFTGAVKTTEGKIEMAQGGTLFLDEVGDIPLPLQVKLLRFLQERVVERIGGRKPIPVDTRIVCATHQNLDAMTAEGTFREDLYYRLAEIVVRIPSLASRAGDAGLLARHFATKYAAAMNPNVKGLAPDALAAVDRWTWPGNVRELENRMKRAIIMAEGRLVTATDLDLPASVEEDDTAEVINLKAVRERADRLAIRRAVARTEGNISNAAKLLGISRPTLYDLLKQYGMQAYSCGGCPSHTRKLAGSRCRLSEGRQS